ncbi:hypothetical protein AS361_11625 [Myroides marinus]|uniref:DUF4303 domain-containing protein n=1 Tax=Myroides marinus TaxID=703342 RepID=UPI00074223E8|nr:DUF4303 domain-containing protein [Myroides marinus]KUF41338.1 hypothetical protein AS361_11625 [Myroides marinus]
MNPNNKEIKLTGDETLKIIASLDQFVRSVDRIKTYYSDPRKNKTQEEEYKAIASYICEQKIGEELALLHGLLCTKLDLSLGEDGLDDVSRVCKANTYWSSKEQETNQNPIFDTWYDTHLIDLKTAVINEFDYLYHSFKKKKEQVYGLSIILDNDCLTGYTAVSTKQSLKTIHQNYEWVAEEWCYVSDEDDIVYGLSNFIDVLIDFYDTQIVPLFKKGFDYELIKQKNLNLFMKAMKEAKCELVDKYGSEVEAMAFFLTIPGEPKVTYNSALTINNSNTQKLKELLEYL